MSRERTSLTHPLRMDALTTPAGGHIGMTLCPGKQQADALSGHWKRDLALDMEAVRAFAPAALVCLVEAHELAELHVPDLPDASRALGVEFHHLPIRDYHAPDEDFEIAWTYHGERLRDHLRAGRKLLLHCKGGLGRTGTIAGRLLVELGVAPAEAIAQVRAARPGTIETRAQEQYVQAVAIPPAMAGGSIACLLGGAVGDGFGYAVEFEQLAQIRARYGAEGLREPVLHDGRLLVSDDTQMTLFTLEGLRLALADDAAADTDALLARVRLSYLAWLATQSGRHGGGSGTRLCDDPAMNVARAPGNTCLSALHAGGDGSPQHPINDSKGCGGVMRVAPVAFLPRRFDTVACFDIAVRCAALTHGHAGGYLPAGVLAALLHRLLHGDVFEDAIAIALAKLVASADHGETLLAVERALAAAAAVADAGAHTPEAHAAMVATLGQGWVGEEALAIGLYAALAGADFPEVVAIASNHDGDSDSTASIAAQIHCARYGLDTLPHQWVMALDVLPACLREMHAAAGAGMC